jgi:hypothetical protein
LALPWMERQALVEDTGLRDLAANIEEIIVACCAAEAAPGASVHVCAPGSATRVTWATELEEVREFGAESDEGVGGPANCRVEEDDDEEFFDCVALLPTPDAETLAAIASLRAVVRPGEPGQCDVPALEQARRELKAAIRRAAAEHEQKQENLLAQLKLRYAVATAAAARVLAGAAGSPTATVGAVAATAGAAGASAKDRSATASPADDKPEAPDTGDTKPELPAPRKLVLSHPGWRSDDTKVFEKDRGKEGNTHTHTHIVLFLVR